MKERKWSPPSHKAGLEESMVSNTSLQNNPPKRLWDDLYLTQEKEVYILEQWLLVFLKKLVIFVTHTVNILHMNIPSDNITYIFTCPVSCIRIIVSKDS